MYLDQRIKRRIGRVFDRMQSQAMLLDWEGRVILPEEGAADMPLPEEIRLHPETPCFYRGYTVAGTDGQEPLYLCLPGQTEENKNAAVLGAGMIGELLSVDLPSASRENAFQYLLREEVSAEELEAISREYGIAIQEDRCVMLLQLYNIEMETAVSILGSVLEDENGAVVEVDRHTVALILKCEERDEDEAYQLGQAIEDTFEQEANSPVYVGVGEIKKTLGQLRESMKEARRAIEVGRIYYKSERVFQYRQLLAERFCADVPREMAQQYTQALFNRNTSRLFNDVMMQTIDAFFDNSLNLSETARKLYIHRNTLVYRLDKIQKTVGLDLRSFDDAAAFWLLMMLSNGGIDRNGRR